MARFVFAGAWLGLVACATAPPAERVSLEALVAPPSAHVTDTKASSSLAEATRRFIEVAQRERPSTSRGASMPEPYIMAWGTMLDAVDELLSQPVEHTSTLDLSRTRLVLETNVDADVGAYGDVPSGLAERIPVALKRLSERVATLTVKPRRADPTHFSWPTSPVLVTSAWGDRLHPLRGQILFHAGVDLWGEPAQEVRAASSGLVAFAGWNGAHGKQVELQHDAHLCTRYSHLQTILVEVGRAVKQGDIIGLLGDTGQVTGPHLHFELRQDGEPVDPEALLPPPPQAKHSRLGGR